MISKNVTPVKHHLDHKPYPIVVVIVYSFTHIYERMFLEIIFIHLCSLNKMIQKG